MPLASHLAQQEGVTVGGEPARVETTYDLTPTEGVKCEGRGGGGGNGIRLVNFSIRLRIRSWALVIR